MKRLEEEGRQAANMLKINYVERFSDRGVRAKASDVERDFRHYFKRLSPSSIPMDRFCDLPEFGID